MSDAEVQEIIIVRRHGGHDEGHHGGAWKIAFADFMTALMAFFLVMWLISASNQTKSSIAQYFNPVQLVGATKQPKGLQDPKPSDASTPPIKVKAPTKEEHPPEPSPPASKAPPASHAESALFQDPYAVLSEIANVGSAGDGRQPAQSKTEGKRQGSGAIGLNGGEAFRDPFAPMTPPPQTKADAKDEIPQALPMASTSVLPPPASAAPLAKAVPAPNKSGKSADEAAAADLRAQVLSALSGDAATRADAQSAPQLDVKKTSEGLLISLTDKADYAMFQIGSAAPDRKVVLMMAKIGQLLKTKPGKVIIRGFTDSRPFKSPNYDNWRLSSARAQMAQYMLIRGGLDEKRVDRIEGHADHNLKTPGDPEGPANRRIEILLKSDEP